MRSTPAPSFAPPGGVRRAGSGLLLLLPCWTRSTPSFARPGGVRGARAGRLLLLPCWTRSTTPPPILSPTLCLAQRRWRRGEWQCLESAPPHLSLLTTGLARRRRRRGAQLDGEFAFYVSCQCCRLRAWPGGGGGGAVSWTGSLRLSLGWPSCPAGATQEGSLALQVCSARGQTTLSSALSWLDGPSDITTRLSLLGCSAGAVVTPAHTFTYSIFHSLSSRREAKLCLVTGPNTI